MNTREVGEIAQLQGEIAFKKSGYVVLNPIGHEQPYDFVAEKDGEFIKVQSKSGRIKNGSIDVHVCTYTAGETREYSKNEIDVFSIYVPKIDETYIVPVEEAPNQNMRLRVDEVTNNLPSIRWADEYHWSEQL
jgi:hypothetical protein